MGTRPPKSTEDLQRLSDTLSEMEDAVKDAILTGATDDIVLSYLIEIASYSKFTDRPLFPNPLMEPIFYRRYFYRWVVEGLAEKEKTDTATNVDLKKLLGARA